MEPRWLDWARRVQALAQSGLTYSRNPFEVERYEALRDIAAEMMSQPSGTAWETVRDLFAEQTGYATPKVDVRGVVFRDGRLLLVRELRDGGRWTLPGGFADVGDTPSQAAVREVREESGYETRAVKLLACWDRSLHGHAPPGPFHLYKLFFLCELTGGARADGHETAGAEFFAEDAIPELSLGRTTPSQVKRMFEHLRHPEWPADFD